jgi:hypothetical protein
MALELIGASAYINSTLRGNVSLSTMVSSRIYADFAPSQDPTSSALPVYPFILFSLQSVKDVLGASAQRLYSYPLYNVHVIGQDTGYAALQPIAELIDALLPTENANLNFAGQDYTISCFREKSLMYAEPMNGRRYSHLGALYRLYCSAV